jgi:hypothetical protein
MAIAVKLPAIPKPIDPIEEGMDCHEKEFGFDV